MKKNDVIKLTATDLSREGYGVAHYENKAVFIADLLPEEEADVKIIKVLSKYAIGIVIKRYNDATTRISPKCPVAKVCGGCQIAHIDYPAQLAFKNQWMERLFKSVDEKIEVRPILGCKEPYHYRNKAQFPVQSDGKTMKMGFYRKRSNDIVPCAQCEIQSEKINEVYAWIQEHLSPALGFYLRHIFIRHSKATGQVQVVWIGSTPGMFKQISKELYEAFDEVVSVIFNENERNDNVILGEKSQVLAGVEYLQEECLGNTIELSFKSFFQVNPDQMNVLYQQALQAANLKKDDVLIDLYAGTGTIGLAAAKHVKEVIGIEIVEDAVKNANENARINHIENARYICQDASEFAAEFSASDQKADVIIVDPPRKGLTSQGIEDICTIAPERLVYISCNPDTLARDLKLFKEKGYQTKFVQPVDMFAHTTGIETVAFLFKE
jgi:23S rRNA (uracil1939-C5)-methyltransferase